MEIQNGEVGIVELKFDKFDKSDKSDKCIDFVNKIQEHDAKVISAITLDAAKGTRYSYAEQLAFAKRKELISFINKHGIKCTYDGDLYILFNISDKYHINGLVFDRLTFQILCYPPPASHHRENIHNGKSGTVDLSNYTIYPLYDSTVINLFFHTIQKLQ